MKTRILRHLRCILRGGNICWHVAGICRDLAHTPTMTIPQFQRDHEAAQRAGVFNPWR